MAAVRLREGLFGPFGREEATSAYRLIHGAGDGIGGFHVDVYEGFLVVQVLEEEALARADALEAALDAAVHPRGIVRKLRYSKVERGRVKDEVRGERVVRLQRQEAAFHTIHRASPSPSRNM